MRTLQLLRHAKSDWNAGYESDLTRPLAERGRRAARKMAGWMSDNNIRQDIIYTSPATRTRQTLECLGMEMDLPRIEIVDDLYHADLDILLAILAEVPQELSQVMLVGHNPGMEDLLLYLCDDDVDDYGATKLFPTAAFAHIELPVDWHDLRAHAGRLRALIRPRQL